MARMVRLVGAIEFMVNPGKGAFALFPAAAYADLQESGFHTKKMGI